MEHTPNLRILFATSFSDACFRTARAIAQFGDRFRIGLTIAHVAKPGAATVEMRRELDSFLGEADHYDSCRRLLLEAEDPVHAIADMSSKEPYDLVLAPASDRLGLHSLFSHSFRAELMKRCEVPVWTASKCLDRVNLRTSIRTISCLIDFDAPNHSYIRLAMTMASRIGAQMRFVHVVPNIDEGLLAKSIDSEAPLAPEVAMRRIRTAFGDRCAIDVAVGTVRSELPKLLCQSETDLLFTGPGQAVKGWWRPRIPSYFDHLPCPVVCMDGASARFARWSFEDDQVPNSVRSVVRTYEHAAAGD
jgi:hypothetical protein